MIDPYLNIHEYARMMLVERIMHLVRPKQGRKFREYLMRAPMRTLEQVEEKICPR